MDPVRRAAACIGHRPLFVVSVTVLGGLYLSSPFGPGGLALFATAVAGVTAFVVGPLIHRPVNRRPWRWLAAAGLMFLTSLIFRYVLTTVPGLVGEADLWSFVGYACTAQFLRGLLRQTRRGPDPALWLDTAAITTGSALIGWVMNIAPQLSRPSPELGQTVVNTMYPVMDAMLLALTVQLAFRRGSGIPALQGAVTGIGALLVGDLAYTFVWAADPGAVNPYVNLCYLIAYASMGLMAAHPSMRELSDTDIAYTPTMSRPRLAMIFMAMVTPASVPIMLPTHGRLDAAVRAVVMVVFGALVFLRLLRTVQDLRSAEGEAKRRATHDLLTGLPNRVALLDRLETHLETRRDDGEHPKWVNVLLLDCDHFKQVNDSWGHAAGDEVLIQVAHRLRSVTPDGALLTRVGGDEFVLFLDTDRPDQAEALATTILEAFNGNPLRVSKDRSTLMSASLGIAQARSDAAPSAEDMIRDADIALYEAKGRGRSTFSVYDASMHERIARRHKVADSLRTALPRNEIGVVFQPIRSGAGFSEIVGWEALARWDHPDFGPVSPLEFIPIAEDTGLIIDIGRVVLSRACEQLRGWQERYRRPDLHVAVNISSVQLLRDDVVAMVREVIRTSELPPSGLWLEITESVVLDRTDEVIRVLNNLNDLGVKVCMDDFGTGYSSLSYLKDFKVNILKIDRAFVQNLVEDPRDRKLTKAMVDVSRALGLDGVVAEGVETKDQAELLARLGCTLAQGYLFGRPANPEQATAEADRLLLPGADRAGSRPGPDGRAGGGTLPRQWSPAGARTSWADHRHHS